MSGFVASIENNTNPDVIGTYITTESTVYDENGNEVTDFDAGDGFQYINFSFEGVVLYQLSNKEETPIF